MASLGNKAAVLAFAIALCGAAVSADEARTNIANRYAEAGLNDEAILEYKRSIFIDERAGSSASPDALFGLAKSYAAIGKYGAASDFLERFRRSGAAYTDEAIELELNILERTGFSNFARIRLLSLQAKIRTESPLRERTLRACAKAAIQAGDWDNARDALAKLETEGFIPADRAERAEELISKAETTRTIPKPVAIAFSAVVPGLGQAVEGNPGDGAKAFIVNAGAAGFTAYCAASGNASDAIFFGVPLFIRFYAGNLANAGKAAETAGERDRKERADKIIGTF